MDHIAVRHDRAELRSRGEAAAAHLIAEGANEKAPPVNPSGAVHTSVCGWLPKGAGSMNFETAFPLRSGREREAEGVKEQGASRLARTLAQAEEGARLLASGEVARRSELARRWGVTRARVTQVLGLLGLSPRARAFLVETNAPISEWRLREVVRAPAEAQVAWARATVPGFADAAAGAATSERQPIVAPGGEHSTARAPRRASEYTGRSSAGSSAR